MRHSFSAKSVAPAWISSAHLAKRLRLASFPNTDCGCPDCSADKSRSVRIPSPPASSTRSEEHTSELQSRLHLVCRLLLEKKKTSHIIHSLMSVVTHTHA